MNGSSFCSADDFRLWTLDALPVPTRSKREVFCSSAAAVTNQNHTSSTMKLSIPCSCLLLLAGSTLSQAAFSPASNKAFVSRSTALNGYLDDITKDLYGEDPNPDLDAESRQKTRMENNEKDRYGPGNWKDFVDFDEFDGGDGQMGVAGDGQKGLEKSWKGEAKMGKSKMMSAKNAWGKDTGYAQQLIDEGIEATRAQQLENWQNQREVQGERNAHRFMTESFDRSEKLTGEEDWRTLKSFGVERNQVRVCAESLLFSHLLV